MSKQLAYITSLALCFTYTIAKKRIMLLRHHTVLCQHKRFRYLLEQGVYIADRYTPTEEVLLFQLRNTYVEVAFARQAHNIVWTKFFTDTDELEPYLPTISIDPVFQ